jgi:hypothetical protein
LRPSLPPSETCFSCRGCCVFDHPDSPWLPYFRQEEIDQAIAFGVPADAFRERTGTKITPLPHGDAFRCPALDPETHACTIYNVRPLDCQLYPFILMRDKTEVILALHEACPFVLSPSGDLSPALQERVNELTQWLKSPAMADILSSDPHIVMPTQPDTIPTHVAATDAMLLNPFRPENYPVFDQFRFQKSPILPRLPREAEAVCPHPAQGLAHRVFQPHLIWSDLLDYRWAVIENGFCLFATSHGITHLAFPPFYPDGNSKRLGPVAAAFNVMANLNPKQIPSRIDNVDEETAQWLEKAGYDVQQMSNDYLYRRDDMINLTGNRFRSQRASVNQAERRNPLLRPFVPDDIEACISLFDQWRDREAVHNTARGLGQMMREDARFAHLAAMKRGKALGLIGRVVEIDRAIVGYTFGFWLAADQFCVLIEIADRSIRGISAWLFREFCREQQGAVWINTMDDAGLSGLAHAKMLWHPARLIPSYTVTASNV